MWEEQREYCKIGGFKHTPKLVLLGNLLGMDTSIRPVTAEKGAI